MIAVPNIGLPYDIQLQARNSLQPPEFGHWAMVDPVTPVESTLPIVDAPAAPSKTGATSSSITISWTAVTGAAKYRVRYKTGTNAWNTVEVAAATRYTAEMLDASTTYRFEVSAYGDGTTRRADWGAWSTHLDAATNAAPTVSGCTTTLGSISGESSYEGEWTSECVSSNRPGTRYARYFTFELATAAELTIELVSGTDPYLYLMEGAGTSGTELAKNDDSRDFAFGYRNSRITYEAAAGTFTAEATTYPSTSTGDLTITIKVVTAPGAPRNVSLARGDRQLTVNWESPESDGGAPITGYRVRFRSETADEDSGSGRPRRDVVDPNTLWNFRPWQEPGASGNRDEIAAALDEEATYLVEVQARNAEDTDTNRFGAWSTQRRTNQRPAFALSPYRINVSEDTDQNGSVGVVSATDPEGDGVTYALEGTDIFQINQTTGQITAAVALSGRGGTTYTMTATATDGVNLPVGVEVLITVDLGAPPAVTAPTASFASDGVTVDTEFTLPRDGFRYRLVLYKYLTSTTRQVVSVHSPDFGDDAYAFFINDEPDSTEEYFVGLRACRAGTTDTTGCETEQVSGRVSSSPTSEASIVINSLASSSLEGGRSTTFSVDVSNLASSQTYNLEVRTANGGVLKFDGCGDDGEDPKSFDPITNALSYNRTGIVVFACVSETNSGTVTAVLSVDGTEIASSSETISTTPIPTPHNLRGNGDSSSVQPRGRAVIRWDPVDDRLYGYSLRYGEECFTVVTSGVETGNICDDWTTVANTNADSWYDMNTLTIHTLYRVQVKREYSGLSSAWSAPVFVFTDADLDPDPFYVVAGRVATMPYFGYMPDQNYEYVICEDTIPSTDDAVIANYVTDIENGIEAWETSVRWMENSRNIISVDRDSTSPCMEVYPEFTQDEIRFLTSISQVCVTWLSGEGVKACVRPR